MSLSAPACCLQMRNELDVRPLTSRDNNLVTINRVNISSRHLSSSASRMKSLRRVTITKLTASLPNPYYKRASSSSFSSVFTSSMSPLTIPTPPATCAISTVSAVATMQMDTASIVSIQTRPVQRRNQHPHTTATTAIAPVSSRSAKSFNSTNKENTPAVEALFAASNGMNSSMNKHDKSTCLLDTSNDNTDTSTLSMQKKPLFLHGLSLSSVTSTDRDSVYSFDRNNDGRSMFDLNSIYASLKFDQVKSRLSLPNWCRAIPYSPLSDCIHSHNQPSDTDHSVVPQQQSSTTSTDTRPNRALLINQRNRTAAATTNTATRRRSLTSLTAACQNVNKKISFNPLLSATPLSCPTNNGGDEQSDWVSSAESLAGLSSLDIPEQGPPAYTAKPSSPPPAYTSPDEKMITTSLTSKNPFIRNKLTPAARLEAARLDMANTCNPTLAWHVYRLHKLVAARTQIYRQLTKKNLDNNNNNSKDGMNKQQQDSMSFSSTMRHLPLAWTVSQSTYKKKLIIAGTLERNTSRQTRVNSKQWLMRALETSMMLERKIICPLKPRTLLSPRTDQKTSLTCTMLRPSSLRQMTSFNSDNL